MKKYRWSYRAEKDGKIIDGKWTTALPASQICKWFEDSGYEIIYLKRGTEFYSRVEAPLVQLYDYDAVANY